MKKYTTILFCLLAISLAENTKAQITGGQWSFGLYNACPQNEFKDSGYSDGFGWNLSYVSKHYSLSDQMRFQWGSRMDFAGMDSKEFGEVPLNVPVADDGILRVKNSMFGWFGIGRFSYPVNRFTPYCDALIGFRTFNTQQQLTAKNPSYNPDYESVSYVDQVVFTSRFSYGGSLGVLFKLNRTFSLESSVTYTWGNRGAIMPLDDIYRDGDILRYPHTFSHTDMLLIQGGINIQLFKYERTSTGSSGSSYDSGGRRESSSPPPSDSGSSDPPPKNPLQVKPPSKPKKNDLGE